MLPPGLVGRGWRPGKELWYVSRLGGVGEGQAGGGEVGWLFPAPAPSFKGAAHDLAQPLPPTALTLWVLPPLPPSLEGGVTGGLAAWERA